MQTRALVRVTDLKRWHWKPPSGWYPSSSSLRFPCFMGQFNVLGEVRVSGFIHPGRYVSRVEGLIAKVAARNENTDIIKYAAELAWKGHCNQVRGNKRDPYSFHPLAVAEILESWGMGAVEIAVGFLHDMLEDAWLDEVKVTEQILLERLEGFSDQEKQRILLLIKGVTELGKEPDFEGDKPSLVEIHKKFLEFGTKDIAIIMIKFADRLHNLQTLDDMSKDKQGAKAFETLNSYVPLADAFGMWDLKRKFEDFSFKYINLDMYQRISAKKDEIVITTEAALIKKIEIINGKLGQTGLLIKTYYEERGIFELYDRMRKREGITLDDLSFTDVWRVCVVIPEGENCAKIIDHVHKIYMPEQGEIRDFVNDPCLINEHQFWQTYVKTSHGNLLVQVRNEQMDREYHGGLLARMNSNPNWFKEEKAWLTGMSQALQQAGNISNEEADRIIVSYAAAIKVYIDGEECNVPFGANIATVSGDKILSVKGGIVNGRRINDVFYRLKHGDRLEILSDEKVIPLLSWLDKIPRETSAYKMLKSCFESMSGGEKNRNAMIALAQVFEVFSIRPKELLESRLFEEFCNREYGEDPLAILQKIGNADILASEVFKIFKSYYSRLAAEGGQQYAISIKVLNVPAVLGKVAAALGGGNFNISDISQETCDDHAVLHFEIEVSSDMIVKQFQMSRIRNILGGFGEIVPSKRS